MCGCRWPTKPTNAVLLAFAWIAQLWIELFGKKADHLGSVQGEQYTYAIKDNEPLLLKYITETENRGAASFIVGIIKGILNSTGFETKEVSYHTVQDMYPATQFLIRFEPSTIEKEKKWVTHQFLCFHHLVPLNCVDSDSVKPNTRNRLWLWFFSEIGGGGVLVLLSQNYPQRPNGMPHTIFCSILFETLCCELICNALTTAPDRISRKNWCDNEMVW